MQNSIFLILFPLTILSCGYTAQPNKNNKVEPNFPNAAFNKATIMDTTAFWEIIDYSFKNTQQNKDLQEKLIIEKLSAYTAEQIIDFEIILRKKILEADDYKIIAAEKIIEGSVTDDPYLYFRCWLIGQGKNTFKETLKNPDFLADKLNRTTRTNFEPLLYVATSAYKIRTGKNKEDLSFPRNVAILRDRQLDYDFGAPLTKGVKWKIEDLPIQYPKLWAKFN